MQLNQGTEFRIEKMNFNDRVGLIFQDLNDFKELLSNCINENNIALSISFADFYEKLLERLDFEKQNHLKVMKDEDIIISFSTAIIQAILSCQQEIIKNNVISYDATDFVNDFASKSEMIKKKMLSKRMKELLGYLNESCSSFTPLDLDQLKIDQIIPQHQREIQEKLGEVLVKKAFATFRETQMQQEKDWEKKITLLENKISELNEVIKEKDRIIKGFQNPIKNREKKQINENVEKHQKIIQELQKYSIWKENNIILNINDLVKSKFNFSSSVLLSEIKELNNIETYEIYINCNDLLNKGVHTMDITDLFDKVCGSSIDVHPNKSKILKATLTPSSFHFKYIFTSVNKCKQFTEINFDLSNDAGYELNESNSITFEETRHLSKILSEMHSLTHLTLNFSQNNFYLEKVQFLVNGLNKMKNLVKLALVFDFISGSINDDGMAMIVSTITLQENLEVLKLSFNGGENNIGSSGISILGNVLKTKLKLKTLDLNLSQKYKKIEDSDLQILTHPFQNLINLTSLRLVFEGNKISENGISAFFCILRELNQIKSLILIFNQSSQPMTEKSFENFSRALRSMALLTTLILDFNRGYTSMTDRMVEHIFNGLQNAVCLEKLFVALSYAKSFFSRGDISDLSMECIATALDQAKTIKELNLAFSNHRITSNGFEKIIEGIKKLNDLEFLSLQFEGNQIDENGRKKMEEFKSKWPNINLEIRCQVGYQCVGFLFI